MKTLLLSLSTTLVLVLATVFGLSGRVAAYDVFQQTCLNSNGQSTVCKEAKKNQNASGGNSIYGKDGIITKAITILDIIIGIAAVIMIIIGGLKMTLSNGDSNAVNSARNTVLYAIIGIVIAVSGQIIVKFVLNRL